MARCMQHAPSNDSHFISFRNWISRRSIGLRAAPLYSVFSSIRWKTIAFDLPSEQKSWHLRMDQIACSAIVGVVKTPPQCQGGVPPFGHDLHPARNFTYPLGQHDHRTGLDLQFAMGFFGRILFVANGWHHVVDKHCGVIPTTKAGNMQNEIIHNSLEM